MVGAWALAVRVAITWPLTTTWTPRALAGMGADNGAFFRGQAAGFIEDFIRHADFSDVMQDAAFAQRVQIVIDKSQIAAQFNGQLGDTLHELVDSAYFKRTILVASAHNMPVESFPWRFSSVISVGSHEEDDPLLFYANPNPPVEFFARGVNVDVAWAGGETIRASGNSFATPCISGIAALILGKHPGLTPFQLKSVMYLIASNVGGGK